MTRTRQNKSKESEARAYLNHARSQVDAMGIVEKAHLRDQTLEPV
jgi:hypothetical protein